MQTLVERIYEHKIGADGLYRMLSPNEIRIPARFPGAGIEIPMEFPGKEIPTEVPLEVRLGCQVPQGMYAMYSFGINDTPMTPVTIGGWFEPLAGATISPYGFEQPEIIQPYDYRVSHGGVGTMTIHRETGDCLHNFEDGGAHIDIGSNHQIKLGVERMGPDPRVKDIGGYF